MKKIEITELISKQMTTTPYRPTDLLGRQVVIDSYEKFIYEFGVVQNIFKEKIPEFYDVASQCLEKMELFIRECIELNDDMVQKYINDYFRTKALAGNSPQILFAESMTNDSERTEMAFVQIYEELGYKNLKEYIYLVKNPSSVGSYFGVQDKQEVAFHYMLYKTKHHSNARLKRDKTIEGLYQQMNQNVGDAIKEITQEKDEYISFMNGEKQKYASWFEESDQHFRQFCEETKSEYDSFMEDSNNRLLNLENTYSEKLKVEKPAEFMEKKAKEYKRKTVGWAVATVLLSVALLVFIALILDPEITMGEKIVTIQFFNNELPVYSSVLIFAMLGLVIYVLKLFIKMMISSKHMKEEYYQKYVLTYFYLALIKDGKLTIEQGNVILATLFSKADTGLIKNDNNNEMDSFLKTFLIKSN